MCPLASLYLRAHYKSMYLINHGGEVVMQGLYITCITNKMSINLEADSLFRDRVMAKRETSQLW